MRYLVAVIGLLLVMVAPALAAGPIFGTPKELLDYAYGPYATGDFKDDNDLLYSKALNALFATAEADTPADDVGPVDFDVFVNGQDFELKDLAYGEPQPEGQGVAVSVTFKNFDQPQTLVFHMVKEGPGWKIADLESLTPGAEWRLTTLLTPAPDDDTGTSDGAAPADASSSEDAAPAN